MKIPNNTLGLFIISVIILIRSGKILFAFLFLTIYPIYYLINSLFLFLDKIFFPSIREIKINNPVLIMGVNRSGTTFFHKVLSNLDQFQSNTTWDYIFPSVILRKILNPVFFLLVKLQLTRIEGRKGGHSVKLHKIEEDEMLLFLHRLDSQWISNHLIPWFKVDQKFSNLSSQLLIDNPSNIKRHQDSVVFLQEFWKKQLYLGKKAQILSKSNPFIFKGKTIQSIFPDIKMVFLIRDPKEVLVSYFSMQEKIKFGNKLKKNEKILYRKSAYQEIKIWYEETEKLLKNLNPNSYMIIKYCDLLNNFQQVMKRVSIFLDLQQSKQLKDMLSQYDSSNYSSEHKNFDLEYFDLNEKQIHTDFNFVYKKYFN